ncbi:MAG TPA: RNA polymerase sigma factor [Phycisphaerae bacterium]|nr:RNA polymerase sigma factor [Phycisphaerae bacterium]
METPQPAGRQHDADRMLLAGMARGESDALVELMRRNGPWVRGVIFAACGDAGLVDDVQQEVWLRAWRRAGTLSDPAKWRGWLYSLAYHAAVDAARRDRRRRTLLGWLSALRPRRGAPHGPADRMVLAEEHQRALRAVEALPELYRVPFVLRHLSGWSYRQIADAMALPLDTVETRLVRARRLLRERLSAGGEA